jgi:hypothetical protein
MIPSWSGAGKDEDQQDQRYGEKRFIHVRSLSVEHAKKAGIMFITSDSSMQGSPVWRGKKPSSIAGIAGIMPTIVAASPFFSTFFNPISHISILLDTLVKFF